MKPLSSIMQPANTIQPVQPLRGAFEAYAERDVSVRDEPTSVMGAPQLGRPVRARVRPHVRAAWRSRAPSIRVDFALTTLARAGGRSHSYGARTGRRPGAEDGGMAAPLLALESPWSHDFDDVRLEWRRLFSEFLGTFLLVLAGAGGAVVDAASGGQIGRGAGVTAPG